MVVFLLPQQSKHTNNVLCTVRVLQNPKAHSTALGGASDSSEAQEDDKLGPLWHDQPGAGMGWGPGTGRGPGAPAAAAALPVPPPPPPPATCITRSSPIAPLTEMELEVSVVLFDSASIFFFDKAQSQDPGILCPGQSNAHGKIDKETAWLPTL